MKEHGCASLYFIYKNQAAGLPYYNRVRTPALYLSKDQGGAHYQFFERKTCFKMEQRGVHWGSLADLLRASTLALVLYLSLKDTKLHEAKITSIYFKASQKLDKQAD